MADYFIDPALLAGANPAQKARYEALLTAKTARLSPLHYMMHDAKTKVGKNKAKEYRHTVYLNTIFMAMVEKRLYKDGPGPPSIVIGVTEDEPHGRRVHPVTHEPIIQKLMTSMPPRIGKSFFFGRYVPAWYLTVFPTETIMYMSYGASLAEEFSQSSRDTIKDHPELGIQIDPSDQSVKEWKIDEYGGGFIARGFGGIPTGRGGNLLIDDPFQDGDEAMSENRRNFVWNQYVSSLLTRVERDCWIVVNGTRWHEDDLHGRLQAHEGDEWFVINLPAIAFDESGDDGVSIDPENGTRDALGRRPGEAICPQLYPASYYLSRQKSDPFWYEAEYLGKPSGVSGMMFKEFSHYKRHQLDSGDIVYELFTGGDESEFVGEKDCVRFATVDLAISDKQSADWTVYAVWDKDPWGRLLLREIVRERVTGDNHDEFVRTQHKKWGVRVTGIENVTYGTRLIQDLVAHGGITIWPLKADKDKVVRAIPAAQLNKKGMLYIDRDAAWRPAWESEHKKFPKDKHDDMVDTTGYAPVMAELLKSKPIPPPPADSVKPKTFTDYLTELTRLKPKKKDDFGMVISG